MTTCDLCGLVMNIKAYENHRKRVHGVGEKEHLCTHCAKKCWTPKELEIHIDKWHTLKTETCSLCPPVKDKDKKLFTPVGLKEHHQSVHNKKLACPKCEYKTGERHRLHEHFRVSHLKYLRYACTVCNNQFSKISNAKAHYQQVHLKNMAKTLDKEFFEKNKNLIESKEFTDPDYPTENDIRNIILELKS